MLLRRFDTTLKEVGPILKGDEAARAEAKGLRAQLDVDLEDVIRRLEAGEITLQEAHQELHAASERAFDGLAKLPGDVGPQVAKALGDKLPGAWPEEAPEWPGGEKVEGWQ